jgi:N-methylhydantoinase A/oxoprolinase/acetone carboxylase beta subunit
VLCAFGDASTALRHEASTTVLSKLSDLNVEDISKVCNELREKAAVVLEVQGVAPASQKQFWEADCRFKGQATNLPVSFTLDDITKEGAEVLVRRYVSIVGTSETSLMHVGQVQGGAHNALHLRA